MSAEFWGTVLAFLAIVFVGCLAELAEKYRKDDLKLPPLQGPDSCLDAVADQEERGGVLR